MPDVRALDAGVRRLRHHLDALARRLLPHHLLLLAPNTEAAHLHLRRRFAGAELDPPVGHQVEGGDTLRDARRVVVARRHQRDAVPEADVLRALAGGGEEDLRCGGVRVFLEEVVLDLEHVVEAEAVSELDLVEGVLQKLVLCSGSHCSLP